MADAKALFRRHWKIYQEIVNEWETGQAQSIIYGFCILAEAIRNEQDDVITKEPNDN